MDDNDNTYERMDNQDKQKLGNKHTQLEEILAAYYYDLAEHDGVTAVPNFRLKESLKIWVERLVGEETAWDANEQWMQTVDSDDEAIGYNKAKQEIWDRLEKEFK